MDNCLGVLFKTFLNKSTNFPGDYLCHHLVAANQRVYIAQAKQQSRHSSFSQQGESHPYRCDSREQLLEIGGDGVSNLFAAWAFEMIPEKMTNRGDSFADLDSYTKISSKTICLAGVATPIGMVSRENLCPCVRKVSSEGCNDGI